MRLITLVTSLDTSSMLLKRFPWSNFFSFGNKSMSADMSLPDFDLSPKLKKLLCEKRFGSIEEVSNDVTRVIRGINNEVVLTGIQELPKRWTVVIKHNGDYIEGL
jgi:hypothetical protein